MAHEYVRRGGLDVAATPWACNDVEASIFYMRADRAKLQAMCDRVLNGPLGLAGSGRYRPALKWVALTFQRFKGLRSQFNHWAPTPSHTYTEASFWVLVAGPRGPALLIPYMFVDDWIALAAGREVYGFPKEFATIEMPPASGASPFRVSALCVAATKHEASVGPVMQVREGSSSRMIEPDGARPLDLRPVIGVGGPLRAVAPLVSGLYQASLPMIFLRQVRSIAGGPDADLRQVICAAAEPFTYHDTRRLLFDYRLRIEALDSHPIAGDFGFRRASDGTVPIPFGLQCHVGFTLAPGKVH